MVTMVTLTLWAGVGSDLGTVETSTNDLFADLVGVDGVAVFLALLLVTHLLTHLLGSYLWEWRVGVKQSETHKGWQDDLAKPSQGGTTFSLYSIYRKEKVMVDIR